MFYAPDYNIQSNNFEINILFGMSVQTDFNNQEQNHRKNVNHEPKQSTLIHIYDLENDPLEKHNLATNQTFLFNTGFNLLKSLSNYNSTAKPVVFPKHRKDAVPINGFWKPWADENSSIEFVGDN